MSAQDLALYVLPLLLGSEEDIKQALFTLELAAAGEPLSWTEEEITAAKTKAEERAKKFWH